MLWKIWANISYAIRMNLGGRFWYLQVITSSWFQISWGASNTSHTNHPHSMINIEIFAIIFVYNIIYHFSIYILSKTYLYVNIFTQKWNFCRDSTSKWKNSSWRCWSVFPENYNHPKDVIRPNIFSQWLRTKFELISSINHAKYICVYLRLFTKIKIFVLWNFCCTPSLALPKMFFSPSRCFKWYYDELTGAELKILSCPI